MGKFKRCMALPRRLILTVFAPILPMAVGLWLTINGLLDDKPLVFFIGFAVFLISSMIIIVGMIFFSLRQITCFALRSDVMDRFIDRTADEKVPLGFNISVKFIRFIYSRWQDVPATLLAFFYFVLIQVFATVYATFYVMTFVLDGFTIHGAVRIQMVTLPLIISLISTAGMVRFINVNTVGEDEKGCPLPAD